MVFEALLKMLYQPPAHYLDEKIMQNGTSIVLPRVRA